MIVQALHLWGLSNLGQATQHPSLHHCVISYDWVLSLWHITHSHYLCIYGYCKYSFCVWLCIKYCNKCRILPGRSKSAEPLPLRSLPPKSEILVMLWIEEEARKHFYYDGCMVASWYIELLDSWTQASFLWMDISYTKWHEGQWSHIDMRVNLYGSFGLWINSRIFETT